ncbi:MAG: hypothetical protein JRF39_08145 [Deltaproteobacteria bacterium]|nr:hypothetical protein [Deltaproteobacteria bacterium]
MKSKMPLFFLLTGYISSLVFYLIWHSAVWLGSQYEKTIPDAPNIKIVLIVVGISALYLTFYYLILSIESFQTPRQSFFFVLLTTLLTFFLIPTLYYARYHFVRTIEKIYTEKRGVEEIEAKLNNAIAKNDAANKSVPKLQAELESDRKENDKLSKQKNETIRKTKAKDEFNLALRSKLVEEHKTKGDVVVQAKPNKGFYRIKTNSAVGNTDSDTKNQEIIFKVQIISSSTRLATNSPQFKGLKNVWEYKDNGLFKYTVGNQKDFKSASALQSEFRRKGFSGAFVVTFKNGKRIPVREALRLLN